MALTADEEAALEDVYPGVRAALGPAAFTEVVRRFAIRQTIDPEAFAAYVVGLDGVRDRWVADLVRLERALFVASAAPSSAGLAPAGLREDSRLTLAPGVGLIASPWRLAAWYAAAMDEVLSPSPEPGDERLLLWRDGDDTCIEPLTPAAFAFLAALARGESVGEAARAAGPTLDLGAESAALTRRRLIVAVDGHGRTDPRAGPFGHVCGRCTQCCRDTTVRLDPFDLSRLARALGVTAREAAARHTVGGAGVELEHRPDGSCVFLDGDVCAVRDGRPTPCRIYPLRLAIDADGAVTFARAAALPGKIGRITDQGTVGDYLTAEGAEPHIAAAQGYHLWLARAERRLGRPAQPGGPDLAARAALAASLLDLDNAVAAHCAVAGQAEPDDIAERLALHVAILDAALRAEPSPDLTARLAAAADVLASASRDPDD